MGSSNPSPELSLDFKPPFIPKTITEFLGQVSRFDTPSHKIFKVDDFIHRLEAETRKIEAFKRELPLCTLLINEAIVALKEESGVLKKSSMDEPVLEEFMPLKKSRDEDAKVQVIGKETDNSDKKNWLSSTQLWNTNQSHDQKQNSLEQMAKKRSKGQDHGREFIPFKGYCGFPVVGTTKVDEDKMSVSRLPFINPEIKNPKTGNSLLAKTGANSRLVPRVIPIQSNIGTTPQPRPPQLQTCRKQRRCWSTELHRRFVNALQQLGGPQAATPKQIRELMQVDGLTNDEVKSHLQKYRLHTRRLPSSNTSSTNDQSGVVLGGFQDQYVESSKHSNSQSGSPDGPFLSGTSTTGCDSMDDGDDEKSENYCWTGHLHISSNDNV